MLKINCSYQKKVKLSDLVPHPDNPNTHPLKQIELLAELMRVHGWRRPITVSNQSGYIVRGHCRLSSAQELGEKYAPVDFQDYESPELEMADLAADNAVAELSNMNDNLLENLISKINEGNPHFDFRMTGLQENQIQKILKDINLKNIDPDEIPNISNKVESKTGTLYKLNSHRLICGDCTDFKYLDKLLNNKKADMLFTDPPYGVDYGKKNKFLNTISPGNRIQDDIQNDTLSIEETKKVWFQAWKQVVKKIKPGGPFYIFSSGADLLLMMMMSLNESDLLMKQTIIWKKNNIVLGRRDYKSQHENIIYGWRKGAGHKFYGSGGESTVWEVDKPLVSKLHPTMKPVALIEKAIINSSKKEDIVLDIFSGSGSTLIACENLGRIFTGIEISPQYCDVIVRRWEDYTGQKAKKVKK